MGKIGKKQVIMRQLDFVLLIFVLLQSSAISINVFQN